VGRSSAESGTIIPLGSRLSSRTGKVEIAEGNLQTLHLDLTLGRRKSIRLGDAVTKTEISGWSPSKK
jgi:hypothetical protein